MKLYNRTKGVTIAEKVEIADTFFKKLLGLMFRESYEGAMLFPVGGRSCFHTMFCRFPILFLCVKDGRVACKKVVYPWRFACLEGDVVIELDARRGVEVDVGDEVVIVEDSGEG